MDNVTIFRKDEFGAVRAVTLEGEPRPVRQRREPGARRLVRGGERIGAAEREPVGREPERAPVLEPEFTEAVAARDAHAGAL